MTEEFSEVLKINNNFSPNGPCIIEGRLVQLWRPRVFVELHYFPKNLYTWEYPQKSLHLGVYPQKSLHLGVYSQKSSHLGVYTFHKNLYTWECIIEYGSTLYVGMTQKKNGGPIKRVQNLMFRTLPWM